MTTTKWTYTDANSQPLFVVTRYDKSDGSKSFSQIASDGRKVSQAYPDNKPLLYLPEILKGKPVVLCEGEVAADAAQVIIGDEYIATTWCGGAGSPHKTDLTPLYGRKVLLWPDNDDQGRKAMNSIAAILHGHCTTLKIINPEFSKGWDAANALSEGWDKKRWADWVKPRIIDYQSMTQCDVPRGTSQQVIIRQLPADQILQIAEQTLTPYFRQCITSEITFTYQVTDFKNKQVISCENPDVIYTHLANKFATDQEQILNDSDLKRVITIWRRHSKSLPCQPEPFAWSNEDKWCLKKLPFVPTQGDFEPWKEFLFRLSAPEDFMAFLWSIFEPENESRQFLYLYDKTGLGGKTTIIRAMGNLLGNAFVALNNSMTNTDTGGRWLMSMLYGKRVAVWPDCKNPKFPMSEMVRNITSGDIVPVEFKGRSPFSTRMKIKLIIASNQEPEITGIGADQSRLLRIDISPHNGSKSDPKWYYRLLDTLPGFLYECREQYRKRCPNNGDITLAEESLHLIRKSSTDFESRLQIIVDEHVQFGPDYETAGVRWQRFLWYIKFSTKDANDLLRYIYRSIDPAWLKENKTAKHRKIVYKGFQLNFPEPGVYGRNNTITLFD